jgi:antitoxin component YwqK of YwqJK toxin-antitoxin module
MKKTFILFITTLMMSCSGEIYEDQIVVKQDGLAYNKESDSIFSGDVLDKYGELVGIYKKGLKDGDWFEVDTQKGTQKKAKYIKGVPEGEQVTYLFPGPREKNKRLEYIKYEDGKIVGTWTTWSKDSEGRLITRGEITFEDGAGRWKERDPNTRAMIKAGNYKNWEKSGLWKSWDPEGVLVSEGEYSEGKKIDTWIWYEGGKDTGWKENYLNGLLNGPFHNLSPYSFNRGKGAYREGVKTGDWKEYFTMNEGSLALKKTGSYQFGKKEGVWAHYKKEDNSIIESNIMKSRKIASGPYEQDVKTGEWIEGPDIDFGSRFYGRGQYKNNKKTGVWNYVAPQENPTISGSFKEGEPFGVWKARYNKKNYEGTLKELMNKVPKLNEYKF